MKFGKIATLCIATIGLVPLSGCATISNSPSSSVSISSSAVSTATSSASSNSTLPAVMTTSFATYSDAVVISTVPNSKFNGTIPLQSHASTAGSTPDTQPTPVAIPTTSETPTTAQTPSADYILGQGPIYGTIALRALNENATEVFQEENPNTTGFVMCPHDMDEQVGAQITCQLTNLGVVSPFYIHIDSIDTANGNVAHLTMLADANLTY